MSWEAWGTDDDYQMPEGYVSDERADEMVKEAIAEAADKIPTTWLDPLLSGPNAVLQGSGPWGCPDIERLLKAIKERFAAEQNINQGEKHG